MHPPCSRALALLGLLTLGAALGGDALETDRPAPERARAPATSSKTVDDKTIGTQLEFVACRDAAATYTSLSLQGRSLTGTTPQEVGRLSALTALYAHVERAPSARAHLVSTQPCRRRCRPSVRSARSVLRAPGRAAAD